MKLHSTKILVLPVLFFWLLLSPTYAENISRWDIYSEIGKHIDIPDSYRYINLFYADINENDIWFSWLQKLVYTWKIRNKVLNVFPEKNMTQTELYTLLEATADKNLDEIEYLKSWEGYVNSSDLKLIRRVFWEVVTINIKEPDSKISPTKLRIFNDVYDSLNANHYNSANFTETELINSAIEWLARGTGDINTSYFPPSENKDFQEELQWEFSGIWAHVDMTNPGDE